MDEIIEEVYIAPPSTPQTFNFKDKTLIIEDVIYADRDSYLAVYPDRITDCLAIGWGVKHYKDNETGKVITVDAEQDQSQYAELEDVTGSWPPAQVPPDVMVISKAQCLKMLYRLGISNSNVLSIIESIEDQEQKEFAKIEWDVTSIVEKSNPLVQLIANSLTMDDSALTLAFNEASKL
jgi:hypothetical protein